MSMQAFVLARSRLLDADPLVKETAMHYAKYGPRTLLLHLSVFRFPRRPPSLSL
jgi:hypothetical protein